jgi:toxin ParE1/3/4
LKVSTNSYRVRLTAGAKQDLASIVGYVARNDSEKAAGRLLEKLLASVASLGNSPERGSFPAELLALGSREYRQIISRPYRFIYKMVGGEVLLFVIADGRREFQALLSRRLLAQ